MKSCYTSILYYDNADADLYCMFMVCQILLVQKFIWM